MFSLANLRDVGDFVLIGNSTGQTGEARRLVKRFMMNAVLSSDCAITEWGKNESNILSRTM